jgi:hypothetical protein
MTFAGHVMGEDSEEFGTDLYKEKSVHISKLLYKPTNLCHICTNTSAVPDILHI